MSVLYRCNKRKTVVLALVFGLAIVGLSAATAAPLGLEPLYVCVLVLGYMFLVGAVIWNFKTKFMTARELHLPQTASGAEIRSMLKKRGFGAIMKKKKK
jgi:predicted metallopeptidase